MFYCTSSFLGGNIFVTALFTYIAMLIVSVITVKFIINPAKKAKELVHVNAFLMRRDPSLNACADYLALRFK